MGEQSMIYKLVPRELWQEAELKGVFKGAPVDLEDGYIHFSSADNVEETAAKWFCDIEDVLVVVVDPAILPADKLKYEVSRGGALFPHLYDDLLIENVTSVFELPKKDGKFDFWDILSRFDTK